MAHFDLDGVRYETTEDGYLLNVDQWNEKVAAYLARQEGIDPMTEQHWDLVKFLRHFYKEYHISPMVKILMKELEKKHGKEKASRKFLYELFPKGPSLQGTRLAGLPKPPDCIDG